MYLVIECFPDATNAAIVTNEDGITRTYWQMKKRSKK